MTGSKPDFTKFARRATVRTYDAGHQISDETLKALVEAASHAPTTGNMQLYTVVATRSPERKKLMRTLHLGQPMAETCSVLLTVCADVHRFGKWCSERKAVSGLDNLSGMLMAVTDACLFAQQLVAAAESQGIGTCYLGTVTYDINGFAEALEVPEGVLPLFAIALGYPQGELPAPSDRLPVEAILHTEKYHTPDSTDINRYYAAKEALPESSQFIAGNGKETLAQVYADVRYPKAMNEKIADDLALFIKNYLPAIVKTI